MSESKEFSILDELRTTFSNGYYLRTSKGYSGSYVAWCKREPFTGNDPFDESGDVWFEFGLTREVATSNLWASMATDKANIGGDLSAIQKTVARAMDRRSLPTIEEMSGLR